MHLLADQQLLQIVQVFAEILASDDASVIEGFEGDQRVTQQLFGDRDVPDGLVEDYQVSFFGDVEVRSQAVLLVLLLEALEIAEPREKAHQHLGQAGGNRCAPALLPADDLIAAPLAWCPPPLPQWPV